MTKHVHSELIHAWADGAEVEFYTTRGTWEKIKEPSWSPEMTYRLIEAKRYRVGLWDRGGTVVVDSPEEAATTQKQLDFNRWLTDWVSYAP